MTQNLIVRDLIASVDWLQHQPFSRASGQAHAMSLEVRRLNRIGG